MSERRSTRGTDLTRRYSAAVLGDGSILPITETLGRRVIREIDPMSVEGRALLGDGQVSLWSDDGARIETAPIQQVLDRMQTAVREQREAYPNLPRWTAHHDQVLKSIGRMKRTIKPRA